jgi:hypothetical protein
MKKFWLTLSIAAAILTSCANKSQQGATLSGLKAENFKSEVKGKTDKSVHSQEQSRNGSMHYKLRRKNCFYYGT